jgi:hypothetical protein
MRRQCLGERRPLDIAAAPSTGIGGSRDRREDGREHEPHASS